MSITQEKTREIIEDFAREIEQRKIKASPAETTSIDFRNGIAENREETVYKVPLDLLRYRKENGRISSSVKTYERTVGPLDPTDSNAQTTLQNFLYEKDQEKTDQLKVLLRAEGQREPGIVTVDGFLINGNRRKVALTKLKDEFQTEDKFQTMKVVILPGKDDPGGPPTLKEIEQIENRYQMQTEGKADYYGFDEALSIRDKEEKLGYTLEQQMRDDPLYKDMQDRQFKAAVKKRRRDFLDPLECVEDYLNAIGKPGEYTLVSTGVGDREGRWQAFIDFSQYFFARVRSEKERNKLGIDEKEAGEVMQVAYKIIRLRDVPNFGKLHGIMRDLPKFAKHGKKHLLEMNKNINHKLPDSESTNEYGERLSPVEIEGKWKNKYRSEITRRLVLARSDADLESEKNGNYVAKSAAAPITAAG